MRVSAKALEEMKTVENQLFKQYSCELILSDEQSKGCFKTNGTDLRRKYLGVAE